MTVALFVEKISCFFTPQNKQAFLKEAVREIPTRSQEEIQQHEQWYQEYCMLLNSKKKVIREWKEKKQVRVVALASLCPPTP